jgi:hypothetical protein
MVKVIMTSTLPEEDELLLMEQDHSFAPNDLPTTYGFEQLFLSQQEKPPLSNSQKTALPLAN